MRHRLRALVTALLALPLAPALALAVAPSAHAADPTTMTNGFYTDPDSSAKRWAAAKPGDGRAPAIDVPIANTPMARWFGSGSHRLAQGSWASRTPRKTAIQAGRASRGGLVSRRIRPDSL